MLLFVRELLVWRDKYLVILLGPTASGKTSMGIELAKWLGTGIISADSRQVYREMIIGTAKPSNVQLQTIPHYLIGHVPVTESYNAGRFEKEALSALTGIFKKNDIALMVGGTGLYINTLCYGLDKLPGPDPAVRQSLREKFMAEGIDGLQAELKNFDPDYCLTVDMQNSSRLLRALEVCRISGRPYSSFLKGKKASREFNTLKIGMDPGREKLIERINLRVEDMMNQGLLEEARTLLPFRKHHALKTVGYQELFDHLDGKLSLEQAVDRIKINTRRYAKRQMTWFRKDREIIWFQPHETEAVKQQITLRLGLGSKPDE